MIVVKIVVYIVIFIAALLVGLFAYWYFTGRYIRLPKGEPRLIGIVTEESQREIFVTDGVKHSVPLDEIIFGGPPKDGIPSIDSPKFLSVREAEKFLEDNEPGVAFSRGNTHRFYPYQILVWHEIVNDIISAPSGLSRVSSSEIEREGERILVTYCPLCLTGIVFDPVVKGERVEFGTSGKLWKSNLVMYDRKTESLWPQILGEAVVGEMTGVKLAILPSDQLRFGDWKKIHPDGQVLSRDTGATRFYGTNPYGDYFKSVVFARQLAGVRDTRLPANALVFGIVVNGKAKAYSTETVMVRGLIEDEFQNTTFVLRYEKDLGVIRMFKKLSDSPLERINPFSSFWFSWAAAHPETEVYK